jgi:hypothetical protein
VKVKELGRDIPFLTRQLALAEVLRIPCAETSPISRLSRFGFHALKVFSLGQKYLANAAGTADPKPIDLQPPGRSIA